MNVLLISPRAGKISILDRLFSANYQPLGIFYIEKYLHSKGVQCEVLDANYESNKKILNTISRYDAVAVATFLQTVDFYRELANKIRGVHPNKLIIAGGPDASARPHYYLENNLADVVVIGEAENTVYELLTRDRSAIAGIAYKKGGEIVFTKSRERIIDLDILPFPGISRYPYRAGFNDSEEPDSISIITSRGCPFQCTFCSKAVFHNQVTYRSIDNIIAEIKQLVLDTGVRHILFHDDVFILNRDRAVEFCKKLMEQKINIKWVCLSRVESVDEQLLKLMKEAGCYRIDYGIESGCPEILKGIKKYIDLEQAKKVFSLTRAAGMEVIANFIIGFPNETKDQIRQTLALIWNMDIDYLLFSEYVNYDNSHPNNGIRRYNFNSEFGRIIFRTNLKFYARPDKLLKMILFIIKLGIFKQAYYLKRAFS